MVTLERVSDTPYRCDLGTADLKAVANDEKPFPREWVAEDGFSVTEDFVTYARPLIQGEVAILIRDGLPDFIRFAKHFVR